MHPTSVRIMEVKKLGELQKPFVLLKPSGNRMSLRALIAGSYRPQLGACCHVVITIIYSTPAPYPLSHQEATWKLVSLMQDRNKERGKERECSTPFKESLLSMHTLGHLFGECNFQVEHIFSFHIYVLLEGDYDSYRAISPGTLAEV